MTKLSDLRRELREREEKIMVLEGEVTKWEQRYLQESAMRQLAIDVASMPKCVTQMSVAKHVLYSLFVFYCRERFFMYYLLNHDDDTTCYVYLIHLAQLSV